MTTYFPAKQIIPNLWIGSQGDSEDAAFMKKHNIKLIVNCSRDIPFSFQNIEGYRVPVHDSKAETDIILKHWPTTSVAIDEVLRRGQGVLVHCRAGMQRSAATVAAYLMYKTGASPEVVMKKIKKIKTETFYPTATFDKALHKMKRELNARNK